MAKFRLGKHEKWVLVTCYKKTVLRQLPDDWKTPRTIPTQAVKQDYDLFWNHLYKSEILLNYFGLKPFADKETYGPYGAEYFDAGGYGGWDNGEYKGFTDEQENQQRQVEKVRVTYSRLKHSLVEKDLVYIEQGPVNSDRITLTEEGEAKAKGLLNVKSDS